MKFSKYIDHTLLATDAKKEDIIKLCEEAKEYDFYSVCVQPYYVSLAKECLKDSDIKVASVIGFPQGQNKTDTKLFEAVRAVHDGADELDIVINVAAVKNKDYDYIKNEMKVLKKTEAVLKFIIETCLLTRDEIEKICEIALEIEVDFLKTSTGFSKSGADLEDVKLMKSILGDKVKIKASGGIGDYEKAKSFVDAGASRLGASKGIQILEGIKNE
ncbi:MAG: deoxyribose-phosphate aldolase [Tissierellia bacterium]|nr:deoxyribose-phosphate aldolase [Tissierellia bacterium]